MESPGSLDDRVQRRWPMIQKPSMHRVFRRERMPDLSLRSDGSDAREHRRELEKGNFTSPQMKCQLGLSRGSSMPRVLRGRVLSARATASKLRYGSVRAQISTLLGRYRRSSPLVFFRPALQGLCGSQKKIPQACVDCGVERDCAISAPWSPVRDLPASLSSEACRSLHAIRHRETASGTSPVKWGAVLIRGCSPCACMSGRVATAG